MLGPEQMRSLKRWLNDGSGRVKIIVTSVPFVPDSAASEGEDKWSGFHNQRIELLEHIERNQIRKVVFFSGDIHASLSIELISPSNLKMCSVVSSAFFWPYPHPSARHFRTSGTIDGGQERKFRLANASRVIGDDNFSKITVSPTQIEVEVFERKGKRKTRKIHRF